MTSVVSNSVRNAAAPIAEIATHLRQIDPVSSLPPEFQLPVLRQLAKLLVEHGIAAAEASVALHGALNADGIAAAASQANSGGSNVSAGQIVDASALQAALKQAGTALDLSDVVAHVQSMANDTSFVTLLKTEAAKNGVDLGVVREALKHVKVDNIQVLASFDSAIAAIRLQEREAGNSTASSTLQAVQSSLNDTVNKAKSSVTNVLQNLDQLFEKAA